MRTVLVLMCYLDIFICEFTGWKWATGITITAALWLWSLDHNVSTDPDPKDVFLVFIVFLYYVNTITVTLFDLFSSNLAKILFFKNLLLWNNPDLSCKAKKSKNFIRQK